MRPVCDRAVLQQIATALKADSHNPQIATIRVNDQATALLFDVVLGDIVTVVKVLVQEDESYFYFPLPGTNQEGYIRKDELLTQGMAH